MREKIKVRSEKVTHRGTWFGKAARRNSMKLSGVEFVQRNAHKDGQNNKINQQYVLFFNFDTSIYLLMCV